MKNPISIFALALSGAVVAFAGADAAEVGNPSGFFQEAAVAAGPMIAFGSTDNQHEVIQPPSSIDPGMALDPPQTGAKMPIIHPPDTPSGRLVLPR
jgi:hypothetical protein